MTVCCHLWFDIEAISFCRLSPGLLEIWITHPYIYQSDEDPRLLAVALQALKGSLSLGLCALAQLRA